MNARTRWVTWTATTLSVLIGGTTVRVVLGRSAPAQPSSDTTAADPSADPTTASAVASGTAELTVGAERPSGTVTASAKGTLEASPAGAVTPAGSGECSLESLADTIGRIGRPKMTDCTDPGHVRMVDEVCVKRWQLVGGGWYESSDHYEAKGDTLFIPDADVTTTLQQFRTCTGLPAKVRALDLESLLQRAMSSKTEKELKFTTAEYPEIGVRVHRKGVYVEAWDGGCEVCSWELEITSGGATLSTGCGC